MNFFITLAIIFILLIELTVSLFEIFYPKAKGIDIAIIMILTVRVIIESHLAYGYLRIILYFIRQKKQLCARQGESLTKLNVLVIWSTLSIFTFEVVLRLGEIAFNMLYIISTSLTSPEILASVWLNYAYVVILIQPFKDFLISLAFVFLFYSMA